ncbi:MAG: MFS transporter, partial [Chthoniobacterales bacterium]
MEAVRIYRSLNSVQRNTFLACFLGWTLDALDFFLLTFVVRNVAHDFSVSIVKVTFAITLTLMMRPLGALIFGRLGDRYGRCIPLMVDIIFYSLMELLTAFSPNFTVFLIFRALYGIGMGGEWGLGASLAMESLPAEARGLASGILQQGYSFGFLIAAVVYWTVFPHFGWRALFVVGALPALLVIFIRARVPESEAWQRERAAGKANSLGMGRMIRENWRLLIYAILLMTAFNYMSHGTQDLYPTFLQKQRGLTVNQTAPVAIIYNLGAICGGTLLGFYSQRWGRRRTIIIAAVLGILLIPLWIFSPSLPWLIVGGFSMQFMVQGAWGVVPVHLNELSPPGWRGTFPGVVYQLGNFFSANAA